MSLWVDFALGEGGDLDLPSTMEAASFDQGVPGGSTLFLWQGIAWCTKGCEVAWLTSKLFLLVELSGTLRSPRLFVHVRAEPWDGDPCPSPGFPLDLWHPADAR